MEGDARGDAACVTLPLRARAAAAGSPRFSWFAGLADASRLAVRQSAGAASYWRCRGKPQGISAHGTTRVVGSSTASRPTRPRWSRSGRIRPSDCWRRWTTAGISALRSKSCSKRVIASGGETQDTGCCSNAAACVVVGGSYYFNAAMRRGYIALTRLRVDLRDGDARMPQQRRDRHQIHLCFPQ
ncbi:MAG: hypothetical protein BWY63_02937 [Chloroflexi bacterium ADurb.Bin360]|nr:MAG: hypothetical protein BWY63_02937 [Chloroflexi bacterium ADurb.Bin360]